MRYGKPKRDSRDDNEAELIEALEKLGVTVWPVSMTGLPDLLCLLGKTFFLIEVKNREGRRNRLTPGQVVFFEITRRHDAPAFVCEDIDDILLAVSVVKGST